MKPWVWLVWSLILAVIAIITAASFVVNGINYGWDLNRFDADDHLVAYLFGLCVSYHLWKTTK